MLAKMLYGDQSISFHVPDHLKVFELFPNEVTCPEDESGLIDHALDHPAGCSLRDLDLSGKRVCIICDDISRPTPAEKILRRLIPRLQRLGVHEKDIY